MPRTTMRAGCWLVSEPAAGGRLSWIWVSEAFGEEGMGKRWHQLPGGMELAKRVRLLTWTRRGVS